MTGWAPSSPRDSGERAPPVRLLSDTVARRIVPSATIGDDYFRHNEAARALIGDRTGETYRLGDDVRVRLVEAIPMAGALRFEMLSTGKRDGGPPAKARGGHKQLRGRNRRR